MPDDSWAQAIAAGKIALAITAVMANLFISPRLHISELLGRLSQQAVNGNGQSTILKSATCPRLDSNWSLFLIRKDPKIACLRYQVILDHDLARDAQNDFTASRNRAAKCIYSPVAASIIFRISKYRSGCPAFFAVPIQFVAQRYATLNLITDLLSSALYLCHLYLPEHFWKSCFKIATRDLTECEARKPMNKQRTFESLYFYSTTIDHANKAYFGALNRMSTGADYLSHGLRFESSHSTGHRPPHGRVGAGQHLA